MNNIISKMLKAMLVGGFATIFILMAFGNKNDKVTGDDIKSNPEEKVEVTREQPNIGDNVKIQLPGIDDTTQIIFLTTDKESQTELFSLLRAKDTVGVMELGGTGVLFAVGNGTTIGTVVDTGFLITKVYITEDLRDSSLSQVGKSGWLPSEWVVVK